MKNNVLKINLKKMMERKIKRMSFLKTKGGSLPFFCTRSKELDLINSLNPIVCIDKLTLS